MGAYIGPNYQRQRVEYVTHKCKSCGFTEAISWDEYSEYRRLSGVPYCPKCDNYRDVHEDQFYPTEFPWYDTHLTYSTLMVLFGQMGIPFDYAGEIDPDAILAGLPMAMATDQFGAETLGNIAQCAKMLGVSVRWG